MKYRGTITWLILPDAGLPIEKQAKKRFWEFADIYADDATGRLTANFKYNDYNTYYTLMFAERKPGYFEVSIQYDNSEKGKAYVWKYTKDDEILFRGNWNEDEYIASMHVYIHLLPVTESD